MAKARITPQPYPRVEDESRRDHGCIDEDSLVPHTHKIPVEQLKELIKSAIDTANKKSTRVLLSIPNDATEELIDEIYVKAGKELFRYFRKYYVDPAATAQQLYGKHFQEVAEELFRESKSQKERMNSAWRYQYLCVNAALASKRFKSVSDIGSAEGDFNAIIDFQRGGQLNLYVSVKNRKDTIGGQDFPKAILALENYARDDKNRNGPYCCVFGVVMDRGNRYIKRQQKTGVPHGPNTEIWLSDHFWPFFVNYSYEEIMTAMLEVLMEHYKITEAEITFSVPEKVIVTFGNACQEAGLIDEAGRFNNPIKLVQFFCNPSA